MNREDFIEDLGLVLELSGLGMGQLAEALGVSRMTLNRWQRNPEALSHENLDRFYNFAFSRGLNINPIHEQLFREETLNAGLVALYHGSKTGISGPLTLAASRADNDFGLGFYCGDSPEQSALFVARFPEPVLYCVAFDPAGLNATRFAVDQDWMLAIALYRGKFGECSGNAKLDELAERVSSADYIVAPIADNRMFALIDSFIDGEITDVQCQHSLSATNLGFQYVLRTPRALERVKSLQPRFLCELEKEHYAKRRKESNDLGLAKARVARRQYRGQGVYIDEVFGGEGGVR